MNFCTSAIAVGVTVMVIDAPPVFGTNAHHSRVPVITLQYTSGFVRKLPVPDLRVNSEIVARQ